MLTFFLLPSSSNRAFVPQYSISPASIFGSIFCVMVNLFSCCLYHFVVARRQKLLFFGPIFHRCFLYWAFLLSLAQWAIPITARRAGMWQTYRKQHQCRIRTLNRTSILSNRSVLWNPWSRRVMIRTLSLPYSTVMFTFVVLCSFPNRQFRYFLVGSFLQSDRFGCFLLFGEFIKCSSNWFISGLSSTAQVIN
jgi:hypothetical protein